MLVQLNSIILSILLHLLSAEVNLLKTGKEFAIAVLNALNGYLDPSTKEQLSELKLFEDRYHKLSSFNSKFEKIVAETAEDAVRLQRKAYEMKQASLKQKTEEAYGLSVYLQKNADKGRAELKAQLDELNSGKNQ